MKQLGAPVDGPDAPNSLENMTCTDDHYSKTWVDTGANEHADVIILRTPRFQGRTEQALQVLRTRSRPF